MFVKVFNVKTFTWKDRIGLQYTVFADTVTEAKKFLRLHYVDSDLDNLLFNQKPKIGKMPKALCNMAPAQTVWLYEKMLKKPKRNYEKGNH